MRSTIQATPAHQLSVDMTRNGHGYNFRLISFLPGARRPEEQVKFQATLSTEELKKLAYAIDVALLLMVDE